LKVHLLVDKRIGRTIKHQDRAGSQGNFDFYSTASSQQSWVVSAMGASLGNPTNVLTLHSNVLMNIQHGDINAADSGYAKVIHVLSTVQVWLAYTVSVIYLSSPTPA